MAYPAVRRIERAAAWPLAAACTWEAAALVTGRIPTLTQLCRRHRRWLVPAASAVLALHLWYAPPPTTRVLSPPGIPAPGGFPGWPSRGPRSSPR